LKHFIKIFFALLLSFNFANAKIVVPQRPQPERLVNDFANILNASEQQLLEQKLVAFADSTSNQIDVVIVKSLDDNESIDVALAILREWGVGQKTKNNGVVLLIAPAEHKMSIATGYGLEGALPDGTCKLIIEHEIKPSFKNENYFEGINNGLDAIFKATKGEYTVDETDVRKSKKKGFPLIFILIIIIIIISIIGRFNNRNDGTSIGSGGFGSPFLGPILFGGGFGGGGSSWGGGDSGGGGFGGFGGGSGGGGGASGSW
jgi:uncharacterized protein